MTQAATSLRSVARLTLLTLSQMGLQFAFQILLAKWFGAEADMDAFVAASTLPLAVSSLLATALGAAFVPVYVDTKQRSGEMAAWSMAVQLTCWLFLISVLLWQVARYFAEPVMRALHPGFDDARVWQAAELFQTLSALMMWNSLGALARAWNHCLGRFALTGVAAVVGNAVTLGWAWQRGRVEGLAAVAQGVSIGALVAFAMQMPWVQIFSRGWPVTSESQAALRRYWLLMLPLVLGLVCNQFDPLLDRYLASQLLPGSVSHLGYASRLAAAVLTLSTSGLAVVAFPALARHAALQDQQNLKAEIAAALRFLMLLLIPVVVVLMAFGLPLVRDVLQRGRFGADDTQAVSGLLTLLTGMIVGGSLGEIAAKVFYSQHNTRTPVLVGVMGFAVAVALKLAWYRSWGVNGLAAATSVFYLLNAAVLLGLIVRRLGVGIFAGVWGTSLRAVVGTAAAAGVGTLLLKMTLPWPALCGAAAGGGVFVAVLVILREEIVWRALRMFLPTRQQEPTS